MDLKWEDLYHRVALGDEAGVRDIIWFADQEQKEKGPGRSGENQFAYVTPEEVTGYRLGLAMVVAASGNTSIMKMLRDSNRFSSCWNNIHYNTIGHKQDSHEPGLNFPSFPNQWTIAHVAGVCGHHEMLRTIVEDFPGLLWLRDEFCNVPLHVASTHAKCIETLLLRMKQSHNTFRLMEACNCYGNNPLHCAAAFGCAEAVEVLLGYASREEQDTCSPLLCSRICASANRMGDTPLLTAARYANWNTLVAVVSAGFSNSWELAVHQRNSLSGDSIIHAACCGAGWCNEDDSSASLLRRLVDTLKRELAPASLSNLLQSTNFRDQTALHVAEQWPNIAASARDILMPFLSHQAAAMNDCAEFGVSPQLLQSASLQSPAYCDMFVLDFFSSFQYVRDCNLWQQDHRLSVPIFSLLKDLPSPQRKIISPFAAPTPENRQLIEENRRLRDEWSAKQKRDREETKRRQRMQYMSDSDEEEDMSIDEEIDSILHAETVRLKKRLAGSQALWDSADGKDFCTAPLRCAWKLASMSLQESTTAIERLDMQWKGMLQEAEAVGVVAVVQQLGEHSLWSVELFQRLRSLFEASAATRRPLALSFFACDPSRELLSALTSTSTVCPFSSLDLSYNKRITSDHLDLILGEPSLQRNLQRLSLRGCPLVDWREGEFCMPNLTDLDMFATSLSVMGAQAMARSCPSLRCLNIGGNPKCCDSTNLMQICHNLPQSITFLGLSDMRVSKDDITQLARSTPRLRELDLSCVGPHVWETEFVQELQRCSRIERLCLIEFPPKHPRSKEQRMHSISRFAGLGNSTSLLAEIPSLSTINMDCFGCEDVYRMLAEREVSNSGSGLENSEVRKLIWSKERLASSFFEHAAVSHYLRLRDTIDDMTQIPQIIYSARAFPPLSSATVKQLEVDHGFLIPEDYRCFLLKVGGLQYSWQCPDENGTHVENVFANNILHRVSFLADLIITSAEHPGVSTSATMGQVNLGCGIGHLWKSQPFVFGDNGEQAVELTLLLQGRSSASTWGQTTVQVSSVSRDNAQCDTYGLVPDSYHFYVRMNDCVPGFGASMQPYAAPYMEEYGLDQCRFLTILARENGIGNTNLWSRFKHIKPEDLTLSYVVNKLTKTGEHLDASSPLSILRYLYCSTKQHRAWSIDVSESDAGDVIRARNLIFRRIRHFPRYRTAYPLNTTKFLAAMLDSTFKFLHIGTSRLKNGQKLDQGVALSRQTAVRSLQEFGKGLLGDVARRSDMSLFITTTTSYSGMRSHFEIMAIAALLVASISAGASATAISSPATLSEWLSTLLPRIGSVSSTVDGDCDLSQRLVRCLAAVVLFYGQRSSFSEINDVVNTWMIDCAANSWIEECREMAQKDVLISVEARALTQSMFGHVAVSSLVDEPATFIPTKTSSLGALLDDCIVKGVWTPLAHLSRWLKRQNLRLPVHLSESSGTGRHIKDENPFATLAFILSSSPILRHHIQLRWRAVEVLVTKEQSDRPTLTSTDSSSLLKWTPRQPPQNEPMQGELLIQAAAAVDEIVLELRSSPVRWHPTVVGPLPRVHHAISLDSISKVSYPERVRHISIGGGYAQVDVRQCDADMMSKVSNLEVLSIQPVLGPVPRGYYLNPENVKTIRQLNFEWDWTRFDQQPSIPAFISAQPQAVDMDAFRQRCKELADRSVIVTNLVEAMRSMNKLERVVIKLGSHHSGNSQHNIELDDSPHKIVDEYVSSWRAQLDPFVLDVILALKQCPLLSSIEISYGWWSAQSFTAIVELVQNGIQNGKLTRLKLAYDHGVPCCSDELQPLIDNANVLGSLASCQIDFSSILTCAPQGFFSNTVMNDARRKAILETLSNAMRPYPNIVLNREF